VPYTPLVLDPTVPESIQAFVAERVEPVLRQVRALLALPVSPEAAGVERVAAPALFSVLGGLSQVFFHSQSSEKLSFLALAERYPTGHEPGNAIKDAKRFADLLYMHHRASLVHGLGLNLLRDSRYEPWRVAPLAIDGKPMRLQLARTRALPVTENFVAGLESTAGGVAGAGATLSFAVEGLRLELDAFYCGVRRVTRRLAEDVTLQPGAVRVLQPWLVELRNWENETASQLLSANTPRPAVVGGPTPVRTGAARA
jgi:hypothetical protein